MAVKRLCRLLHDAGMQIVVHDRGRGMAIRWNKKFMAENQEKAGEITELVYRDHKTSTALAGLKDGIYGAMEIWNATDGKTTTED